VFRALSWNEVGAATILSRALCGVAEWFAVGQTPRRVVVWVLPGSTNAVRLALEKVIAPELGHLAREVRGRGASGGPQAGAST
jgi:molybdenum cofactor biosynthesis protein B